MLTSSVSARLISAGLPAALDDHEVEARAEPLQDLADHLDEPAPHAGVLPVGEPSLGHTADDHLGPVVGLRLQQDGVHVDGGLDAGGPCLGRSGAADLPALGRDGGVQ
jgi:hypothetical protein